MNKRTRDIILTTIQIGATAIIMVMFTFKFQDKTIPGFLMGIFLAFMIGIVLTSVVILISVMLEKRHG